jgi:hypothetical protein
VGAVLLGGVGAGHCAGVQQAAATSCFTESIEPDPGWIGPCRDARARFTQPALHGLLA